METMQTRPGPPRLQRPKIVLALAFLALAAGFSGPPRPNCKQVPPGETGQPPEVVVVKCADSKGAFRFSTWP